MDPVTGDRLIQITRLLEGVGADAILLSDLKDIRWATGFTGSNALVFIHPELSTFVTDGRYIEQSRLEVRSCEIQIAEANLIDCIPELLARHPAGRLVLQSDSLTIDQLDRIQALDTSVRLVPKPGLLRAHRAPKDESEVSSIRKAIRITERVLEETMSLIVPGVLESDIAAELEYRQRLHGAEGASFDTIVAFGDHSALPHARSSDRALQMNEAIVIDFGCVVDGYSSDMTRSFFIGQPDPLYLKVYATVLEAYEQAMAAASAGMSACDLDRVARDIIGNGGFGKEFSHSLGHGVGLDIHEWPTINKRSNDALPAGAVVTIEPGIYLSGRFGVRIEDMIRLAEDGSERLNRLSTQLIIL